jgi:hypothetical protein
VRIDESRHQYPAPGVNHFAIPVDEAFDLFPAADGFDPITAYEESPVLSDGKLAKVAARARPARARQRDDL